MVAKLSPLLWAVLVFVAKPALADNVTYHNTRHHQQTGSGALYSP